MALTKKVAFSIDSDIDDKLKDVSVRLGITKSSLLNELVNMSIPELHTFCMAVIPEPTDDKPLTRGRAKQRLNEVHEQIKRMTFDFEKTLKDF